MILPKWLYHESYRYDETWKAPRPAYPGDITPVKRNKFNISISGS